MGIEVWDKTKVAEGFEFEQDATFFTLKNSLQNNLFVFMNSWDQALIPLMVFFRYNNASKIDIDKRCYCIQLLHSDNFFYLYKIVLYMIYRCHKEHSR